MRLLICDDDISVVDEISRLIENRDGDYKTEFDVDKHTSADLIFEGNAYYDIAFIDIKMHEISGLELAERLKEINPDIIIIITTSYAQYLDDAMKIKIFRYISKPLNHNRVLSALRDAEKEYYSTSKTIIIDLKNEVYSIKTKDILYLETVKNGTLIVTRKGDFKTKKSPEEWMNIIAQPECFVSSHKSFIVNLQNVIDFNSSEIKLRKSETEVVSAYISQRRFKAFKKSFMTFAGVSL